MSGLIILNTSILTADGTFTHVTITAEQAVSLAQTHWPAVTSYIGHEATAQLVETVLGIPVPVNRVPCQQQVGQDALVFKLNGRSAEGRILTYDDIEAIGFTWKLLRRTA